MMRLMPSSYVRSVVASVFVFVLTFSPYAHAAETAALAVNDPFTDTIQLWSTILNSIDAFAHQVATGFASPQTFSTKSAARSQVPKTVTPPSLAAATVLAIESASENATASTNAVDTSILSQQPKSRSPPKVASHSTTGNAQPLPATSTSAFVTRAEFYAGMSALSASVAQLVSDSAVHTFNAAAAPPLGGGAPNTIAAASAIDNLANVSISTPSISGGTISNASVSGITGLTTSSLSDFSYATTSSFVPGIAAWGDSLTQGAGDTYPAELSILTGVPVYNGGIAGQTSTQVAARMLAATTKYSWPMIIWTGRNEISGVLANDEPTILSNIASMVAALTTSHYIILSIPNGNTEPSGSTNYNEIVQINSDIGAIYGSHYLDEREYLVTNGLSVAGIAPTAQDLTDISNDVPPTDLRADYEHPNAIGDKVIAEYIYQNINILIPITPSAPILTAKNIFSYSENPPTFPLLDTRDGYSQDESTILFASSANQNTLVGDGAGQNLPTTTISLAASYNTAVGYLALATATSTEGDVAIGRLALEDDQGSGGNTAVGHAAMNFNATGHTNDAFGSSALTSNTTGSSNNAFGVVALFKNTTGGSNGAFGGDALLDNTTGSDNAALSGYALEDNTTGSQNVAIGYTAEQFNDSATNTVAIGYEAANGNGLAYSNQGSVALGALAGLSFQTGSDYNTLLGYQSGRGITTGSRNILIGPSTITASVNQITTGSHNISIGNDVGIASSTLSNQLDIGNSIYGTGLSGTGASVSPGMIGIGTTTPYSRLEVWGPDTASTSAFAIVNSASTTEFSVYDTGNAVLAGGLTQSSDQRLKTNIQSLAASSLLASIDALNPVTFNWIDPNKGTTPQLGFIAQQVLPIFPNLVSTTSATALTPDGTLSLNYIDLISPIVSAVQALSADITSIDSTIAGFAQTFSTQMLTAGTGRFSNELCVGSTCVDQQQLAAVLAAANASQSSGQGSDPSASSDATTTSDTAPVIQINGDNPAIIQVGTTYNDLGATITGPQADLNLGITTYVNGIEMSPVQIDTSAVATDTIDYVATDQSGLVSTSTRTVMIEATSSFVPVNDASTTAATTTPQ
jgi:hypothetical protein